MKNMVKNDILWVEKYRPKKVEDCIFPEYLKTALMSIVNSDNNTNLLFAGQAGVGKTTVAKILAEQQNLNYLFINGSLQNGIDIIRDKILKFCSVTSFDNKRKIVILDEADYLNANSTQPALRSFMEQYSKNSSFILTANFENKIIEPLRSRCSTVYFNLKEDNDEKTQLSFSFFTRMLFILNEENIEVTDTGKKALAKLILYFYPDFRKIINEVQRYCIVNDNKLDVGLFSVLKKTNPDLTLIVEYVKGGDFYKLRKLLGERPYNYETIYTELYDLLFSVVDTESIPSLLILLADYQYKQSFVLDKTLNLIACLVNIFQEVKFKK